MKSDDSAPDARFKYLPDGMGWILRPVHAGMCRYESLCDGTLTIEDILIMNASLDIQAHNLDVARKLQNNGNGIR